MRTPDFDRYNQLKAPTSSSRILYDVPCKVCCDHSSGKHYGIFACDGCAGFFKRSIRRDRNYVCKAKSAGNCLVDKSHRNQCRACRLKGCFDAGMNKDSVQNERGPRNSTLRRQMVGMYRDSTAPIRHDMLHAIPYRPQIMPSMVLDLSVHRQQPMVPHAPYIPRFLSHSLPPPPPPLLAIESVYETAAQIFLDNVRLIKDRLTTTKPALPISDQLILLEDSWKDFFIIGATQKNINFNQLICYEAINNVDRPEKVLSIHKEVQEFQILLSKFASENVDRIELVYLRDMILFATDKVDCFDGVRSTSTGGSPCSTSDSKHLRENNKIKVLYETAKRNLSYYTCVTPGRLETLVEHVLPLFANIRSDTIEELFFRRTIGGGSLIGTLLNVYRAEVL